MKTLPFLMFQGEAGPAIDLYRSAFPDFEQLAREEHKDGEMAGRIAMAHIRVGGQEIMLFDSPPMHDFTFTPASSFYVNCDDEEQLRRLAGILSEDGGVLMPADNYGFSTLYTWVSDRFGVSWQLNLP